MVAMKTIITWDAHYVNITTVRMLVSQAVLP